MLSKMSNLAQRIIAGVLGAAVLIGAIYWSEWSFFVIFLLIMSFSLWEFYTILEKANFKTMKLLAVGVGVLIFSGTFWVQRNEKYAGLLLLSIFALLFVLFVLKLYDKNDREPFTNLAMNILGLLYVCVPFSLLLGVSYWGSQRGLYHYQIPLGILFCLWASDSGAYFVGRKLGKTKLFERISPKKSWEGLVGGMFFSQMVAWGLSVYFTSVEGWKWFVISAIIVIVGTYGDLVESMLKRSLGIKDSGSVIPGHGGFLDRFDGLLVAMPFVALFFKLFA
jgi:phosphatidate cytidylyltransferase